MLRLIFTTYFICVSCSLAQAAPVITYTEQSPSKINVPAPKTITQNMSVPAAPDFAVASYLLIDAKSGHVIAAKNPNLRAAPASLTKIMTLYLVANALKNNQIKLADKVVVSEKAWRTGGSRMFIRAGENVLVKDIIKGIATASGNDATVAVAEYIAGSEPAFANLMNQMAHDLNMNNTSYHDSSGLPHENNYTTANDMAILARSWYLNFPEYYHWFKEKWIIYNGIKQPNRNQLLWRDSAVDGIKTGRTDEAGYCLVASAERDNMRLIVVIMGDKGETVRANHGMALLNYGFRFFETHKLFTAAQTVVTPKIWLGKQNRGNLGLAKDLYVTVPKGAYKNLKANAITNKNLTAPIIKEKSYGTLNILLDDKLVTAEPLIALQNIKRTNFLFAIPDYIIMLFNRYF